MSSRPPSAPIVALKCSMHCRAPTGRASRDRIGPLGAREFRQKIVAAFDRMREHEPHETLIFRGAGHSSGRYQFSATGPGSRRDRDSLLSTYLPSENRSGRLRAIRAEGPSALCRPWLEPSAAVINDIRGIAGERRPECLGQRPKGIDVERFLPAVPGNDQMIVQRYLDLSVVPSRVARKSARDGLAIDQSARPPYGGVVAICAPFFPSTRLSPCAVSSSTARVNAQVLLPTGNTISTGPIPESRVNSVFIS